MKKIVFLLILMLSQIVNLMAQQVEDDLYFIPSKDKKEKNEVKVKENAKKQANTTRIYTSPGTTVVVKDRKGNVRDVDEYNRRYSARENSFSLNDDTLIIEEKDRPDLDGEWIGGEFRGTRDDYEYAERIIRFRNPRFAISISSPLYWDIVYGVNSWDWNVYTDGFYAYAFPTFTNPLWWNWRFDSWSWRWSRPYYGTGYYSNYWYNDFYWGNSWYGSNYWGYPYWNSPSWGWGGGSHRDMVYTNRHSPSRDHWTGRDRTINSRYNYTSRSQANRVGAYNRSTGRVVGSRTSSDRSRVNSRSSSSSSRSNVYTRPSSTRESVNTNRGSSSRYSGSSQGVRSSSSYDSRSSNRSSSSNRTYVPQNSSNSRESYNGSSSSSSRSSSSSSSNSRSSSGSSNGGSVRGSSRR